MKVLFIDDEEALHFLYELELGSVVKNAQSHFAHNGEEAFEILKRESFDFIVTDGRMPGLSGIEFTRKLKAMGVTIPVILVTGNISEFRNDHDIKDLFLKVFDKPLNFDEFTGFLVGRHSSQSA